MKVSGRRLRCPSGVLLQLCWSVDVETRICELSTFKRISFCFFTGQSGTVNNSYARVLLPRSSSRLPVTAERDRGGHMLVVGLQDFVFPPRSLESSCQPQGSAFNLSDLNQSDFQQSRLSHNINHKKSFLLSQLHKCRRAERLEASANADAGSRFLPRLSKTCMVNVCKRSLLLCFLKINVPFKENPKHPKRRHK